MKYDALIILGSGISPRGRLPHYVKSRLDEAFYQYKKGMIKRIVLVGGHSFLYEAAPDISEAHAMEKYLVGVGLDSKIITVIPHGRDMLEKVYLVTTQILLTQKYKTTLVVISDYQEARARYTWEKVIGNAAHTDYLLVPSHASAAQLWDLYIYEKQRLTILKSQLDTVLPGDIKKVRQCVQDGAIYMEKPPGHVRALVSEGIIGRPHKDPPHYSLPNMHRLRHNIFKQYQLTAYPGIPEATADFWSGRYLDFLGHDSNGTEYILKFGLRKKDKQIFTHEIRFTDYLTKMHCPFAPQIVAHSLEGGPVWYLYKTVPGTMAGQRSRTYSFDRDFYKEAYMGGLIDNLSFLRGLSIPKGFQLPIITSDFYIQRLYGRFESLQKLDRSAVTKPMERLIELLERNAANFDTAHTYLSHGDLHPANIIISEKPQNVYFIDFENIGYHNIAFDFCFVYLFSWNNPEFQKSVYQRFLKSLDREETKEFERIFPLVYGFFLIWFARNILTWRYRAGRKRFILAQEYMQSEIEKLLATL